MMVATEPASLAKLKIFLEVNNDVQFIHLTFVTYANVHRTTMITPARALEMAVEPGKGKGLSVGQGVHYLSTPHGGWVSDLYQGDNGHFIPDWNSIRLFAGRPGHATVMCEVQDVPQTIQSLDPRALLKSVQSDADAKEVAVKVGYEIEFLLIPMSDLDCINSEPLFVRACQGGLTSMLFNESFPVMEESVRAIEASDMKVWRAYQSEGPNHYEICLSPASPVQAVDDLVVAIDIIKSIANKHGYLATLHPKPYDQGPSMGLHAHISFNDTSVDYKTRQDVVTGQSITDCALASLLKHFRPLRAFLNAGYDSYGCRDGHFGSGVIAWSESKAAPIRHVGDRLEMRSPDAMGNPYLQLAGIIGIAMHGIENVMQLKSKPIPRTTVLLPRDQWENYGITDLLPATLEDSIKALKEEGGEVLTKVFGRDLIDTYIKHKEETVKVAKEMTFAERRKMIMVNI